MTWSPSPRVTKRRLLGQEAGVDVDAGVEGQNALEDGVAGDAGGLVEHQAAGRRRPLR